MKSFFKILFASFFGFVLGILLLFGLLIAIGSSSSKKTITVKENSILHIKLAEPISERGNENPFSSMGFGESSIGLYDILDMIDKASFDANIAGIFLDLDQVSAGIASLEEIRDALIEFKKSGKYITAYSEVYSQRAYYLASVADKVYINPIGFPEWKGLNAEILFFKGVLEKIGVEPIVIRHGKFKSAIEPFISDKMSDENRLQTRTFLGSIWTNLKQAVSKSRKIDEARLQQIADNAFVTSSEQGLEYKLVDAIKYRDEVIAEFLEKSKAESEKKIPFVSLSDYMDAKDSRPTKKGDKIAVIFAEGDIVDGKGDDDQVGSIPFAEAIRKARTDEKVKAIVLRVNSPGGSVQASEVLWRELSLAKKVKPLIVSMGNVAASGGYYIACMADTIVANPNTITGSIGVFGLFFNAQKMLNEKLGVTVDTVKTAQYADILSGSRPMTPSERDILQGRIEAVYDLFITKVAAGRGMTKAQVDSIGQGRVWSGTDARRIGLVDVFGGLDKAIDIAAKKAGLENYKLEMLPKKSDPLTKLVEELSGSSEDSEALIMQKALGESYQYYKYINYIRKTNQLQMRMPYNIDIK
jgi:protease-4